MEQHTLLIIDDSLEDREYYAELLGQCAEKYRILTADNGEDGVKIFKKEKIDCTIIDYNLPDMDGLEILSELRTLSTHEIATIILTGEPHQTLQAEAARNGALNYIVKDANSSPDKMQETVEKTIQWASQINAA